MWAIYIILFEKLQIKPNLTQNGAISFVCVLDDRPEKIEKLALEASEFFDVQVMKGLSLLTIRHYNKEIFEKLTEGKNHSASSANTRKHTGILMTVN